MSKVTAHISSKNRVLLPRAVCQQLDLCPGDTIAFLTESNGVRIEKDAPRHDPFTVFTEWNSAADDDAYRNL